MKKSESIQVEAGQIGTVDSLAAAFKGISSHHIASLKNQVLESKDFFADLWSVYTQLKIIPKGQVFERQKAKKDKTVFVVVTAEGGLSGDIDKRLIEWMLQFYDATKTDIIVLGYHGTVELAQVGITPHSYYPLPGKDLEGVDIMPIIADVSQYAKATVFYQTYRTLLQQEITSIDLLQVVQTLTDESEVNDTSITRKNYIFEPSFEEVVEHMESIMMSIALSQVILESKLAQHASRFSAMTIAHTKASEITEDLSRSYRQARRAEDDESTREINNSRKRRVAYGG